jgi:alanine dehydrogenase
VFACALIVKVKELQPEEFSLLRPGTTLFAFAQLGRDRRLLDAVLAAGINYVAYESVSDGRGGLPLLAPMSRIAGRLAPVIAASLLLNDRSGAGGVKGGNLVVIGAGTVGTEAATVALGMGARVSVLARSETRRRELRQRFSDRIAIQDCDGPSLAAAVAKADVIIGAVLDRGKLSPKLVTRAMLRTMRARSVLMDVGIDQGGIAETSRQTTISEPTFIADDVVHYGVPNMPALVPRTATMALTQATLPYVLAMAAAGIEHAMAEDPGLRAGLQVFAGRITHAGLAADTGRACHEAFLSLPAGALDRPDNASALDGLPG